jgi:4-diphosphocytidyl-2-C-methyl-D-erythritol kinase
MTILERERAYAKINLCLFLGPTRADGRHQLVTLFDSIGLCDELVVAESEAGGADRVVCAGVEGPNLVADALAALRAAGWAPPPLTVTIEKRIPVAAGMGGGSADAAAMLRCAPRLAPVSAAALGSIAARLGADVPGQLRPGPSLGTGAGELIEPLAPLAAYGVLVIPRPFALSTPDVYREADRLGLPRSHDELSALHRSLTAAIPPGPTPELIVNDLQPAALSLAPQIGDALDAARHAGADQAIVCGSGPTVIGIFAGADGERRAAAAASALSDLFQGVLATRPVDSSQFVALT